MTQLKKMLFRACLGAHIELKYLTFDNLHQSLHIFHFKIHSDTLCLISTNMDGSF